MPASSRSRSRTLGYISADGTWIGSPVTWGAHKWVETCNDTIGDYGGNHDLHIVRREVGGSLLVLTVGSLLIPEPGAPSRLYTAVQSNSMAKPSLDSYINRILAATGPLTPNVNLPLALFELKDVPSMLRHAGNLLHKIKRPSGLDPAKEVAAGTLAYQFGWKPIYDDLKKLLNFAEAAEKQQRKIAKANSQHGYRTRVKLDTLTAAVTGSITVWSTFGTFINQPVTRTDTSTSYGTCRWVVRDPSQYGKVPTFTSALKTALGFNKGQIPIQVWKAMPWSWMVDWFTDISSVLQANYNSIYYKPYRLCVMRKTLYSHECRPVLNLGGNPGNYLTAGFHNTTFTERLAVNSPSANVTLRLPFLDNFKMSILGSLAILKIKQ